MGKKVGLATLAGFVVLMILGYLVWVVILGDWMTEALAASNGCMHEPAMSYIIIANLLQALFMALVLYKFNVQTAMAGLIAGIWINVFIAVVNGVWFTTSMSFYPPSAILTDAVTSGVVGGLVGAAIGWALGRVK